jgi:hypothetical protein
MENNIKTDLKKIRSRRVDWAHLAQENDQWRALENMSIHLPVAKKAANFLAISASQNRLCFTE